ncbi:MAG: protein kinase [Myxococcales bacterium]|nr:protein kinase [Myxococcales bacterium]
MRVCPDCRTQYGNDQNVCPADGMPLIEVSRTFGALRVGQDGEDGEPAIEETDPSDDFAPDGLRAMDTAVRAGMTIGEYVVERFIAEGGMGVIYAGIHPVISKRVAIKVLNKRFAKDPKAVARFVLEARSVNQIGHHSIVDIFSIGELDDGRNYMVMELLDGLGLHQILPAVQRFSPGELVPLYEQLCDALAAAHAKGFIHRDLKPDNILVLRRPPRPLIKILDFGIAKLRGSAASGDNTEVGTVLGTPEYMAPEQCRGLEVDARTDVYAMGVMLYELVTGRKPFFDQSAIRVLTMQIKEPPAPPSKLAPISKELERVILRSMAKDPAKRQQSANELFNELRAVVEPERWTAPVELAPVASTAGQDGVATPPPADAPARPVTAHPPPLREVSVPAPEAISVVGELDDDELNTTIDSVKAIVSSDSIVERLARIKRPIAPSDSAVRALKQELAPGVVPVPALHTPSSDEIRASLKKGEPTVIDPKDVPQDLVATVPPSAEMVADVGSARDSWTELETVPRSDGPPKTQIGLGPLQPNRKPTPSVKPAAAVKPATVKPASAEGDEEGPTNITPRNAGAVARLAGANKVAEPPTLREFERPSFAPGIEQRFQPTLPPETAGAEAHAAQPHEDAADAESEETSRLERRSVQDLMDEAATLPIDAHVAREAVARVEAEQNARAQQAAAAPPPPGTLPLTPMANAPAVAAAQQPSAQLDIAPEPEPAVAEESRLELEIGPRMGSRGEETIPPVSLRRTPRSARIDQRKTSVPWGWVLLLLLSIGAGVAVVLLVR